MSIYFVIFFALLCAVVAGFRDKTCIFNSGLYLLATVLMIACAGLRADSVGADYLSYRAIFLASPDTLGSGFFAQWISAMPSVDVAYVYFNSLLKMAGLPFELLIFLMALVVVTLNATFFWIHSRFSGIGLMLYFSHAFLVKEMIQIRAGLACALALWVFQLWANGRKRWGTVLLLFAIMTHMAVALVIIPLLLFHFTVAVKPKLVLVTLGAAMLIGYNLSASFPLFGLLDRLGQYQDTEYSIATGIFSNITTIKALVILGLSSWLVKTRGDHCFSPVCRLLIVSYWISALWVIAFNQFQILGGRGASFLSFGEPFIVAEIVAVVYRDQVLYGYRRLVSFAVVCFALAMLLLDLTVKEVVNDYTTVFQESLLLPYEGQTWTWS